MFFLWNTDITNSYQEVAVEDLVFTVSNISESLRIALSATVIGNWQTDLVIDHNAQVK